MSVKKKYITRTSVRKILFFIIAELLMIVTYMVLVIVINRVHFRVVEDDYKWMFQFEKNYIEEGKLIFEGWAFEIEKDIDELEYEIVLYNRQDDKAYYAKIQREEREDIQNYFSGEYNYLKAGFKAVLKAKDIFDDQIYEILLKKRGSKEAMSTNLFYFANRIWSVNPSEYEGLVVHNSKLQEIIDKGVICVYRPDIGIYVYQYKSDLYWITDRNYKFDETKETYIRYQLYTTKIEQLPEKSLLRNMKSDNRAFYFEKEEIIEYRDGNYRVAKASIPVDYPVTIIWTGYKTNEVANEWDWIQYFRLYYKK